MLSRHINLKQLRVFLTVADLGTFSAAAEHLYLSQSVISRHVAALEDVLGSPLLDRGPRGVETTEAGAVLAAYAHRIFALEDEAGSALDELRDLRTGRLRIGASMTIGNYLLPRVLAAYHACYPHVTITLTIANSEAIQCDLRARTIDIGLTEGFVDDAAFAAHVFADDELVPVVAPDSPLAELAAPTLADLAGAPCVMRDAGSGTRAVLERGLTERGVHFSQAMALGGTEAVKQAVMAGAGLTFISFHAVSNELRTGQLVRLRPRDFTLRRPLHRLQLKHKHPTRAVQAFIALMDERPPEVAAELAAT
jgi:DNA-binding transcriptional LysR family regulator